MKNKTVPELFEKRTGVKYQNWIQAWAVTEKQKRKKYMKEQVIKTLLWITSSVCLYNVLTAFDGLVFSLSGFIGLFSTWILIKWDDIVEQNYGFNIIVTLCGYVFYLYVINFCCIRYYNCGWLFYFFKKN